MDYARGLRIEGAKGTANWQGLKNAGISFVVINGSKGEVDSITVGDLIQEAYDNKVPAIIESVMDFNYYKYYGGVEKVAKEDDKHLYAVLKGLSHKTCYGLWLAAYDSNDIPWNATALGQFVDRLRHELNLIPLRGSEFPMGIRSNQNWYLRAVDQDNENRMSWFYNKPEWLVIADWRNPLGDIMNPGTMNRDKWNFMEYADGKYIFNGTRDQLYTHIKFTPSTQPPPEDEDPEDDDPIIIDIDFTPIFIELDSMKADLAEIRSDLEYIKKHFT